MSAQAGFLYFDRRQIDPEIRVSIGRRLAQFAPDGGRDYERPGLAMIYRALHVTPEDSTDDQPLVSQVGSVMTWDGRLDNRDDLLLRLRTELGGIASDSALAMASYDTWGESGLAQLIGDWSIALWDATHQELTLASDYSGNRSLYYFEDAGQVHWSTSLGELVLRMGIRDELEPRFFVGYLTGSVADDMTPYARVRAVPAGHVVTWSRDGRRRSRPLWQPTINDVRFADRRAYECRLRALFADAVRARLRAMRPVWAELSGGLDSSSVVCMADRLLGERSSMSPRVETISCVTDLSPESDERPFIAEVERQRRRQGLYVKSEQCDGLVDDQWGWVTPQHPTGAVFTMLRHIEQRQGRVLLSGRGGDLIMMNFPDYTGDAIQTLVSGHLLQFLSKARQWARSSWKPIWHLAPELMTQCLSVKRRARLSVRETLDQLSAPDRRIVEAAGEAFLLTPQGAETWCHGASDRATRAAAYKNSGKQALLNGVVEYTSVRAFRSFPECRVLYTHPFTHRPLVEFMLAIPPDVACQAGEPRKLMRAAFGDLLPLRVLNRFSKAHAAPFLLRQIKGSIHLELARLDTLYVVQYGLVDRERLRARLQTIRDSACRRCGNVELVLRLERWFRKREELFASARQSHTKGGDNHVREARTCAC